MKLTEQLKKLEEFKTWPKQLQEACVEAFREANPEDEVFVLNGTLIPEDFPCHKGGDRSLEQAISKAPRQFTMTWGAKDGKWQRTEPNTTAALPVDTGRLPPIETKPRRNRAVGLARAREAGAGARYCRTWTPKEDALLLESIQANDKKGGEVVATLASLTERSASAVWQRYLYLRRKAAGTLGGGK